MTAITKPYPGQTGTFFRSADDYVECEVVHVWSDTCVNLSCEDGALPTSVLVSSPGAQQPAGYYCWLNEPTHLLQPRITGYRQLSAAEGELINGIKAAGDHLQKLIEAANATLQLQNDEGARGNVELRERHRKAEPYRWLAAGRTELQSGLMKLVRAVGQPTSF